MAFRKSRVHPSQHNLTKVAFWLPQALHPLLHCLHHPSREKGRLSAATGWASVPGIAHHPSRATWNSEAPATPSTPKSGGESHLPADSARDPGKEEVGGLPWKEQSQLPMEEPSAATPGQAVLAAGPPPLDQYQRRQEH